MIEIFEGDIGTTYKAEIKDDEEKEMRIVPSLVTSKKFDEFLQGVIYNYGNHRGQVNLSKTVSMDGLVIVAQQEDCNQIKALVDSLSDDENDKYDPFNKERKQRILLHLITCSNDFCFAKKMLKFAVKKQ